MLTIKKMQKRTKKEVKDCATLKRTAESPTPTAGVSCPKCQTPQMPPTHCHFLSPFFLSPMTCSCTLASACRC